MAKSSASPDSAALATPIDASSPAAVLTPMMQQYHRLKSEAPPETILLFRLGDFYEMFFDDAKVASDLLDLTLTARQGTPMCGVPYHAAEGYVARLIRAGKRVAICDQTELPKPGQIVRREITQVLSPGSVVDATQLAAKQNNFLAAVTPSKHGFGLAFIDLTTGEFQAGESSSLEDLHDLLMRINPAELVLPSLYKAQFRAPHGLPSLLVGHEDYCFVVETAASALQRHFGTHSLDGFGMARLPWAVGAAGGLLHYLTVELRRNLQHVGRLTAFARGDSLAIDHTTRRHLELVEPTRNSFEAGFASSNGSGSSATLLGAVDRTVTAGGGRLLRQWLLSPLATVEPIEARQNAVRFFRAQTGERERLREAMRGVRDLERLIGRLSLGAGNARDLLGLAASLRQLPLVKEMLMATPAPLLRELGEAIVPLPELVALFETALHPEPPVSVRDGGIIRDGHHETLDELRAAATQGKAWLAELQTREQIRSGIKSLKVRFNQVFGYYIEISAANLANVPSDYVRKQTMANAERYITPELKEMESKILGAEERARDLEQELFMDLRTKAVAETKSIQAGAAAIHAADILAGWGALAQERDYTAPEMSETPVLDIVDGRHPVLEQLAGAEKFVPNDALLDATESRLIILTGPNMAGKSTYIRQVALIAIMAHCGCFVPARRAVVGLLDRVFTRVGANDDLARGQSTFMVEMNETANILHHATPRSLVILDEIGRGTSTFDGLSIAWAVAEHLHQVIGAKTLFATHYHELTELAIALPGVKNFNVAVREWGEQIVFLRKIIPGGADKSYGIQVARLAGLPVPVLNRAKEILRELEEGELDETGRPRRAASTKKIRASTPAPAAPPRAGGILAPKKKPAPRAEDEGDVLPGLGFAEEYDLFRQP